MGIAAPVPPGGCGSARVSSFVLVQDRRPADLDGAGHVIADRGVPGDDHPGGRRSARFVDVGWEALEAAGIGLPLLSAADPELTAFMTRPGERAHAAGLITRPLVETAEATRGWDRERGEPELKNAPTPEVEAQLLANR